MFTCPHCRHALDRAQAPQGVYWHCPSCGGRAVGIGLLRRSAVSEAVNRLWLAARRDGGATGHECPSCGRSMTEAPASEDVTLDVCRACEFVWFDPGEHMQLVTSAQPSDPQLPEQAREILAMAQIAADKERTRRDRGSNAPDEWWKYLPALVGMPVEYEQPFLKRAPVATWALIGFIAAFSIRAFFNLEAAVEQYGLIPAQAIRHGGLTFITSFLLHGNLLHLIGNMYFLLVFGDNVEDYLGKARYLLLITGAALFGDLAHIALDPRSMIPVIGASGGISGILAFYILRFPKAQLGVLFRFFVYFRWIRMPAYGWGLLWVAFQLLGAYQQVSGASNVSALAHLGGAAVGVAFWWATANR